MIFKWVRSPDAPRLLDFFFFEKGRPNFGSRVTGFCSRNLWKICHPATLGWGQRRLTPPEIQPSLFQSEQKAL